jgi:acetyl esterase/lipase
MSSHLFAAPTMKTPIAVVCSLLLALGAQLPCAAKPPGTDMSEVPGAKPFVFKSIGEVSLKLYVFNPPDHKASDARPALVLFFGGGWMHGDPSQFAKHAAYFASRGMVVVLPEYRTKEAHGTTPFECIADGKSAVRWVRAHATELGIDPQRIAAGGGSAGGHVAASTAVLSDIEEQGAATKVSCVPNALVLFNPVLDTTATGYGAKKLGERAQDASPVHHVRAGLPPTIIFHGEADKTVPFENARRFTDEMTKAGNVCTLMGYEGQDHGFYIRGEPRYYAIVLREADKFLARLGWLTGEPTQPEPAATATK